MDRNQPAGIPATPTINPMDNSNSRLFNALSDRLLNQSGIISSQASNIETSIQDAISGIQKSTQSESQRINSQFGREIGYAQDKAAFDLGEGRAAGTGGVLNMAALREFTSTTDKQLKDLDQRRQELILQNDAQGASKVADLQLQALQFRQQAEQQVFSNLLGIANFGIQSAQEQRLAQQQSFQEQQGMASIALKYGIDVKPGDTLQSITVRAMPFASKAQQLELAKLNSEIAKNNAEAAKALRGDASGVSDSTIPTLVSQAFAFESAGKNPSDPEYGNLLQSVTKAGKLDQFYAQKQAEQKRRDEAQKKQIQQTTQGTGDKPSAFNLMISRLIGEQPAGWRQNPDGTWRKL